MYAPLGRAVSNTGGFILTRVSGDPLSLVGPMRERLAAIDPELPLFGTRTLRSAVDDKPCILILLRYDTREVSGSRQAFSRHLGGAGDWEHKPGAASSR